MRLDHLLSKEQHTFTAHNSAARLGGRQWQLGPLKGSGVIVHLFSVIAVTAITGLLDAVGTLLGPETTRVVVSGSDEVRHSPRSNRFHGVGVGGLVGVGGSGWCLRIA